MAKFDKRRRCNNHYKWANAVLTRDKATCQHCGVTGIEMHAHHLKGFKSHPELRFDLANGITLCCKCHWKIHSVQNENPVNSVKPQTGHAVGNTEPSHSGNIMEGVTDRGRAYRRWTGSCEWCSAFITKPLSDLKGKRNFFCSRECATRFLAKNRTEEHKERISIANSGKKASAETRAKMSIAQYARQARARAVISSKSAGRESDELS